MRGIVSLGVLLILPRLAVSNPAHSKLFFNEVMVDNRTVLQDEAGEFEAWMEIGNLGKSPTPLWFMSISVDDSERQALPQITLFPEEFMILWFDGDTAQGPGHLPFVVDATTHEIRMWDEDSSALDSVFLDIEIPTDLSLSRVPDGFGDWIVTSPTPDETNGNVGITDPAPPQNRDMLQLDLSPQPFNPRTTITLKLPNSVDGLRLRIFDLRGHHVRSLHDGPARAGTWRWAWNGQDDQGRLLGSGIYLIRAECHLGSAERRAILLK